MSKGIERLLDELLVREGGYVNHPNDRGGATNWGITETVARGHGYTGSMRSLPRETAKRIYRTLYWTRPNFDQVALLSVDIAEELFDTGVNMGPGVATTFLQRALNALNREARDYPDLVQDGQLGPVTLRALERFLRTRRREEGAAVMVKALDCLQGERYIRLAEGRSKNEAFVYGWLRTRIGG